MKTYWKKSTYFFAILFVILLAITCFKLLSSSKKPTLSDHQALALTPFTAREQKDLIAAQQQEEQLDLVGPLVETMSATDAQARVLNLNRSVKSSN